MQTVENIQRRDGKGKVRDLTERCLKLSKTLSLTAILLPFLAAAGWILDISLLKQVHPVLPPMQPNTIVGLVLLAIAILLSREGQSGIKGF